jgi:hypothetical protein
MDFDQNTRGARSHYGTTEHENKSDDGHVRVIGAAC